MKIETLLNIVHQQLTNALETFNEFRPITDGDEYGSLDRISTLLNTVLIEVTGECDVNWTVREEALK